MKICIILSTRPEIIKLSPLIEILKNKKVFFLQIFLTLYIGINLIGGERGLISYLKKDNYLKKVSIKMENQNI